MASSSQTVARTDRESRKPRNPSVGPMSWLGGALVLGLSGCGGGSDAASLTSADLRQVEQVEADAGLAKASVADSTSCLVVPQVPKLPTTGVINVRDYGARPDDEADDTTAIQAALDAAKPGQWVIFPPGRYLQKANLLVRQPRLTLWGQGAIVHATNPASQAILIKADQTRLYNFTLTAATDVRRTDPSSSRIVSLGVEQPTGYISGVVIQNNRVLPAAEASGSSLSNATSAAGILVLATRDFTVAGNEVRRSLADGIHITGGSRNGRVVGNQVSQTGDDMIAVVSYLPADWKSQMARSATWLSTQQDSTRVKNIWLADNTVSDQYWGRGMSVVGGEAITLARNHISKTTMAAGILVAREPGFNTHGVSNVVLQGNQIADVQTTTPGYLPSGSNFTELLAKLAATPRTGHGGIELNNLTLAQDLQAANGAQAVGIDQVLLEGNVITRAARDGVRLGADTPFGAITNVRLVDNAVNDAASTGYQNRFLNGKAMPLNCANNLLRGQAAQPEGCQSLLEAPVATGAQLNCASFPAP